MNNTTTTMSTTAGCPACEGNPMQALSRECGCYRLLGERAKAEGRLKFQATMDAVNRRSARRWNGRSEGAELDAGIDRVKFARAGRAFPDGR